MTARKPKPPEGLRDQIALVAMQTLVSADQRGFLQQVADGHAEQSFKNVAAISYGLADAMLNARDPR